MGRRNKTCLQPLLLIQKKAIRIVSHARFLAHTGPLFKESKVLKLPHIHLIESAKFVYNQLNISQHSYYQRTSDIHEHNIRDNNCLRPPKPRTELRKRFITYYGCHVWNNLPEDIKSTNQLTFKLNIKNIY